MYFVYAITSVSKNYIYVGLTGDINKRVAQHNSGHEKTTRAYVPFELLYFESYKTRSEARTREKQLKSGAGKEFLRSIK